MLWEGGRYHWVCINLMPSMQCWVWMALLKRTTPGMKAAINPGFVKWLPNPTKLNFLVMKNRCKTKISKPFPQIPSTES